MPIRVDEEQIEKWADRLQSEMEIVGYVPTWLVRAILENAGVKILPPQAEGELGEGGGR